MTKMTFDEQLRHMQAAEEATLATMLRDDGLDLEVEPALLAFQREAFAYKAAMRNPRAQAQQRLGEYNALHEDERRQMRQPETDADWLFFWQTTMQALRSRLTDEASARHMQLKLAAQRAVREWQEGRITRHKGVIPAPVSYRSEQWHELGITPGSDDAVTRQPRVLLDISDDLAKPHVRQVPAPNPRMTGD